MWIGAKAMAENGGRCAVIGIGNPDRGDDALGREVVRQLSGTMPAHVELIGLDGEAASLLAKLDGADIAYLVDACISGAPPGSIQRFDATTTPLPHDGFAMSTHGLGLAEAIELARALGQLPESCVVYAVEAASFEAGAPLSPPVAAAVHAVAEQLRTEIGAAALAGGRINA